MVMDREQRPALNWNLGLHRQPTSQQQRIDTYLRQAEIV